MDTWTMAAYMAAYGREEWAKARAGAIRAGASEEEAREYADDIVRAGFDDIRGADRF